MVWGFERKSQPTSISIIRQTWIREYDSSHRGSSPDSGGFEAVQSGYAPGADTHESVKRGSGMWPEYELADLPSSNQPRRLHALARGLKALQSGVVFGPSLKSVPEVDMFTTVTTLTGTGQVRFRGG